MNKYSENLITLINQHIDSLSSGNRITMNKIYNLYKDSDTNIYMALIRLGRNVSLSRLDCEKRDDGKYYKK